MNQICNYVDHCNPHCACSKILMHLNVDLLVVPYINMGLCIPQMPSEEAFSLHERKSDFMVTSVTDWYQLPSLFITRLEKCVLSPYFGVSLAFPFVS